MSDAARAPGLAVEQDPRVVDVQDADDATAHDGGPHQRLEAPGLGARLARARELQGLSLGDVARQLKLAVRQVEALERDDYDAFPGHVFVRGFLRNYAKLLQLDLERQIAGVAVVEPSPAPEPGAAPAADRVHPVRWLRWGLAALLALLIGIALFRPAPDAGRDAAAPVRLSAPPADAVPAPTAPTAPVAVAAPPEGSAPAAAPAPDEWSAPLGEPSGAGR